MDYVLLAILWVSWCILHSGMISLTVSTYMRDRLGEKYKYYRLAFNLIAAATLLPVYLYGRSIDSAIVFRWQGGLQILQIVLFSLSLFFFLGGARSYDLLSFLGIRQAADGGSTTTLTENDELETTGVLGMVRHPWYLAGLLILWVHRSEYSYAAIITSTILSFYLIIGAFLEERKLKKEMGEQYHAYMEKVSMLIPSKWLAAVLR